jgi:hypothetical protein
VLIDHSPELLRIVTSISVSGPSEKTRAERTFPALPTALFLCGMRGALHYSGTTRAMQARREIGEVVFLMANEIGRPLGKYMANEIGRLWGNTWLTK